MKKKSSKLAKLERERKSILTDNLERCYFCGKPKNHIHEIFEGAYRISSMKYGCCIPVCWECHQLVHMDRVKAISIKKECQNKFEELYSHEEFLSIFKKSFL